MTRVLLDQGLAPGAAAILRGSGWDAVHVYEIGLHTAEDSEILDSARTEDRICVTLDHDFHAHLALTRSGGPSVILLRVQGQDARDGKTYCTGLRPLCDCAARWCSGIGGLGIDTCPPLATKVAITPKPGRRASRRTL